MDVLDRAMIPFFVLKVMCVCVCTGEREGEEPNNRSGHHGYLDRQ